LNGCGSVGEKRSSRDREATQDYKPELQALSDHFDPHSSAPFFERYSKHDFPKRAQAKRLVLVLLAAMMPKSVEAAEAAGDKVRGERVFQYCYSCHTVDPNEKATLQGPSLNAMSGSASPRRRVLNIPRV
jgi:mono/diheme cytochrome c family protein